MEAGLESCPFLERAEAPVLNSNDFWRDGRDSKKSKMDPMCLLPHTSLDWKRGFQNLDIFGTFFMNEELALLKLKVQQSRKREEGEISDSESSSLKKPRLVPLGPLGELVTLPFAQQQASNSPDSTSSS